MALSVLARLEAERTNPRATTIRALEDALQAGGVEFFTAPGGGEGVHLRAPVPSRRENTKLVRRKKTSG